MSEFVCLIPARGGSKGIPRKNLQLVDSIPLIAHTIDAALKAKSVSSVYVSTDNQEIADVSTLYHAKIPFLRSEKLSSDDARTIDVVMDFVEYLKIKGKAYKYLVLLQPTSPNRDSSDIDHACELFLRYEGMSLASVTQMRKPLSLARRIANGRLEKVINTESNTRRQDADASYYVNGAIYINKISEITQGTILNDNAVPYIMDYLKSDDIDDEINLAEAELHRRIMSGKWAL